MQRKPKNAGAIPRPGRRVKNRTDGYSNGEWEAVMKESDSIMQAFGAEQGACAGV